MRKKSNSNLSKLRERLDVRNGLFSSKWLWQGDFPTKKKPTAVSKEKVESRVNKIIAWQEARSKKEASRRGRGVIETGSNSRLYFNKRKNHAVKVFHRGSDGDYFNGRNRTLSNTLNLCVSLFSARTFFGIDKEIRQAKERLQRFKSAKKNLSHFDPNPKRILEELKLKRKEMIEFQKGFLERVQKFGFNSNEKISFMPFVYSIRAPKIFSEKRLENGEYAVFMEFVRGPTLNGLFEAMSGKVETQNGKKGLKLIKEHKIDSKTLYTKLTIITKFINELASKQNLEGTYFIPRLDSFIVEGIDRQGNLKLVLVDNA